MLHKFSRDRKRFVEDPSIIPMKTKTPIVNTQPRFFLQLLIAAALMAVTAPITALADNLYVSANQDGSIFEYTPAGIQSTFVSYSNLLPRGLAFDSGGNLFAGVANSAHTHGTVFKFKPDGEQHTFGGVPGGPEGVAVDSTGNVFVMSQNTLSSSIVKFTPNRTRSTFASGLGGGFGLAFNSAGNLFAGDANQTIFEYTPGGTRTTFVGPAAFGPNQFPSGQLAFDSAGNLFVSTTGNLGSDSILEFTPGGVESTFATGLSGPRGLAFDSTGNLFVTENLGNHNGDILEFTPGGIETVFASGISNPQFLTFGPARGPAGPNLPDSGSTFGILSIALVALESACRRFLLTYWTDC
jgi:hypothetical protein